MSSTHDCQTCRNYEAREVLFRHEIATLRESVLALTKQLAHHSAALEIVGMHVPERLALAGPVVDGSDVYYQVSMTYRDQLSAKCDVPIADAAAFLRFFEDLAQYKDGWEGVKKVASLDGQLAITCTYESKEPRSEVSMDVSCARTDPSFDPDWTVQMHLDVDPRSLESLAARARTVFATPPHN